MRHFHVFVVSLLLPSGILCISSHSPLDLFAYPAYAVKLNPAAPISNSSAEAVLASATAHRETSDEHKEEQRNDELLIQENSRKAGYTGLDFGGENDHHATEQLTGLSKPYLLRSSLNGQAYLCSVPQDEHKSQSSASSHVASTSSASRMKDAAAPAAAAGPVSEAERNQRKLKNEEEKRKAFERGLALLEPLKNNCLYLTQGWFTYAFCYGSEIRQFHAVKNPNPHGPPLIEDLTQDAYTLGLWSNRLTQDEGLVDIKKSRALGSLREILASEDKSSPENGLDVRRGGGGDDDSIGDERRYLLQRWTGGTMCDKTGVERSIEVQFHCNSQSTDRIFLVRETAICEYVIVIHTPRLCGEQIFVGGTTSAAEDAAEKKRKEINVIECRPVIRDELFQQYVQAGNAASGGARGLLEAEKIEPVAVKDEKKPQQSTDNARDENTGATERTSEQSQEAKSDGAADSSKYEATSEQQDSSKSVNDANDGNDAIVLEEYVLGNYVLAIDTATGKMSIQSDPLDGADGGGAGAGGAEVAQNEEEKEVVQELLSEFRKSLEEMMQSLGGETRNPQDDAAFVKETVLKAQEAFKAVSNNAGSATGDEKNDHAATGQLGADAGGVNAGAVPSRQEQQKADPLSRLTRTGAHNHREIAEKYLKGQLGLSQGALKRHKLPKQQLPVQPGEAATRKERQQRDAAKKLGTAQFRNLRRAFDQKWDSEAEDNKKNNDDDMSAPSVGESSSRSEEEQFATMAKVVVGPGEARQGREGQHDEL